MLSPIFLATSAEILTLLLARVQLNFDLLQWDAHKSVDATFASSMFQIAFVDVMASPEPQKSLIHSFLFNPFDRVWREWDTPRLDLPTFFLSIHNVLFTLIIDSDQVWLGPR